VAGVLVEVLVLADEHWHVRVVEHVVGDGAEECAPEGALATRAADDEQRVLLVRHMYDNLARLPGNGLHFTADLKPVVSTSDTESTFAEAALLFCISTFNVF